MAPQVAALLAADIVQALMTTLVYSDDNVDNDDDDDYMIEKMRLFALILIRQNILAIYF